MAVEGDKNQSEISYQKVHELSEANRSLLLTPPSESVTEVVYWPSELTQKYLTY